MTTSTTIPESSTGLVVESFDKPLSLTTTPISPPTHGSALIRILTTLIRPDTRAGFTGQAPPEYSVPCTPGDTAIARIVATGQDATHLRPGQLVFVHGFIPSRDAPTDAYVIVGLMDGGQTNLFKAWQGLWRDVATVPLEQCHALDEAVLTGKGYTFNDLQIIERLALAYSGASTANLKPGQTVIVAPASGQFSGATAELCAQLGCNVVALSRSVSNLEPLTSRHPRITAVAITGDLSVDTAAIRAVCPARGADAYIDMSPALPDSSYPHFHAALASLRPHAQVAIIGLLLNVTPDLLSVVLKDINIRGRCMYEHHHVAEVIKLVENGLIKLGKEAGHEVVAEFKLEEWDAATKKAEEVKGWGKQVVFSLGE